LRPFHVLLKEYRLAVCTTLTAFIVTLLVHSWSDRTAYALFLCASIVSAYFGGLRPGALATGLGFVCLVVEYVMLGSGSPYRNEVDFIPSMILFTALAGLATYLSHECRQAVKAPPPSLDALANRREAVLLADGKSQVAYLNEAARTLSGWPGNDAVGQALEKVFRVLDEENRQPVKDPLGRVKSTGSSPGPVSSGLFVCKDGSERAIEYWLESIPDPQGGTPRLLCVFRDVSESRRAAKEMRQSQGRAQALVNSAPAGILLLDPLGQCLYSNSAFKAIAGLTHEDGKDSGWVRSIHPDDRGVVEEWQTSGKKSLAYTREFRLQDGRGTIRWVRLRADAVLSEKNESFGQVGTLEDITYRRKMECELADRRQREDHFATLEKSHAALQQEHINRQRTEEKLRKENAELLKLGKESQDALTLRQQAEDGLRREQAAWKKAEERFRHEIAELQAARELSEEQAAMLQRETETLRQGQNDAAEHKHAVEKLKEQHQKDRRKWHDERDRLQNEHQEASAARAALDLDSRFIRSLLAGLAEGVCAVDREGLVTYLNPAAEKILGRGEADLVGKGIESIRVFDENAPATERLVSSSLAARQVIRKDKVQFRKPDGDVATVTCSVAALPDTGRGEGAVVCLQEAGGRARREEELAKQVKRLTGAVRQMDDFIDRVTERFRPTLTRLRDAALQRESWEVMTYQIGRFARLVENVWVVSRLARDDLTLTVQPVELAGLIDWTVQTFSPLLQSRRQHLTVSLPLEPESILGDAERLEQVLNELLDNAARYTAPGGNIRLTAERRGERVQVRIQDSGRGIDAPALARLAEVSARSRRYWDESSEGLGVGLALVHDLVEMQGGTIELRSNGANHGSEAAFWLPAATRGVTSDGDTVGRPVYQGPKWVRAPEPTSDEAR
jgi:PAS domain S-box-containing protein